MRETSSVQTQALEFVTMIKDVTLTDSGRKIISYASAIGLGIGVCALIWRRRQYIKRMNMMDLAPAEIMKDLGIADHPLTALKSMTSDLDETSLEALEGKKRSRVKDHCEKCSDVEDGGADSDSVYHAVIVGAGINSGHELQ